MKLQTIKVSEAYESENNPRGNDFKGASFDDLVASVKEKGVLVPVIARPRKKGTKEYEIVAGNRRFRAAQVAGLKEIPARIEDLTDEQAQEIQIIENLQREDVHPIDEALAYVKLLKRNKNEGADGIKEIATVVGKSESYVRKRLYLTHLAKELQKAFRSGEIPAMFAEMIGRLEEKDQVDCLDHIRDQKDYGGFDLQDLREWIRKCTFEALKANQPWTNDVELRQAVGACVECPNETQALFGKNATDACTDPRCYSRKMAAYIELTKKKHAGADKPFLLVSELYGSKPGKGVLKEGAYQRLDEKDRCKSATDALVVEGDYNLGKTLSVCADRDCKKHRPSMNAMPESAEEKRKRQETAEKQKAKELEKKRKEGAEILKALEKIKNPLTGNQLDALMEIAFESVGYYADELLGMKGIEISESNKAQITLRKQLAKATPTEKLQAVYGLFIASMYQGERKKIMKLL